ncbi:MAG TPA: CBS domain-containing protein [Chloroflexi bacterium]|nr:CBS domain-containing protein [Chloroflexota bacterium]
MLVANRMTPNPITCKPDLSISETMEWMQREDIRRFPVLDKNGKLVGIVTRHDLLHASPSSVSSLSVWEVNYLFSQVTVEEVMTTDVITVCEDCPIEEAARIMARNKIGGLPVMRDDQLVGIITESDIFKVFLELFDAREKGVRLTVLAPYFKGSLAQISSKITEAGGLILALNVFRGDDPTNWGCTLKVTDITKDKLLQVVEPLVEKVIDIREA